MQRVMTFIVAFSFLTTSFPATVFSTQRRSVMHEPFALQALTVATLTSETISIFSLRILKAVIRQARRQRVAPAVLLPLLLIAGGFFERGTPAQTPPDRAPSSQLRPAPMSEEQARVKLLEILRRSDFEEVIQVIELVPGYSRADLQAAATAFRQFIEQADVRFAVSSADTEFWFSMDRTDNSLYVNPDILSLIEQFPAHFFHELTHLLARQLAEEKKAEERLAEIESQLKVVSPEEKVYRDLKREKYRLGLSIKWNSEAVSYYFQMAYHFAKAKKNRLTIDVQILLPLRQIAKRLNVPLTHFQDAHWMRTLDRRDRTIVETVQNDFVLGSTFEPGVISAALQEEVFLGSMVFQPYFTEGLAELLKLEERPPFDASTLRDILKHPRLSRALARWARAQILDVNPLRQSGVSVKSIIGALFFIPFLGMTQAQAADLSGLTSLVSTTSVWTSLFVGAVAAAGLTLWAMIRMHPHASDARWSHARYLVLAELLVLGVVFISLNLFQGTFLTAALIGAAFSSLPKAPQLFWTVMPLHRHRQIWRFLSEERIKSTGGTLLALHLILCYLRMETGLTLQTDPGSIALSHELVRAILGSLPDVTFMLAMLKFRAKPYRFYRDPDQARNARRVYWVKLTGALVGFEVLTYLTGPLKVGGSVVGGTTFSGADIVAFLIGGIFGYLFEGYLSRLAYAEQLNTWHRSAQWRRSAA